MVCLASQWIGIQSWVHHDSIHQSGADSAIRLRSSDCSLTAGAFHRTNVAFGKHWSLSAFGLRATVEPRVTQPEMRLFGQATRSPF
jgi:hypothetical protein